jgi:hypothetical protein
MENLAEKRQSARVFLEYGFVASPRENTFIVVTDTGHYEAAAAIGCVVRPEKGDIVLLSVSQNEEAYILSVLERPGGTRRETTLQFDGQVRMNVRGGGLRLTSDGDMSFASRKNVAIAAPVFGIDAGEGNIRIEKTFFNSRLLQAQIEKMKVIADAVDEIFKRVVQRLTSSYRYVKEHDETQAASSRLLVDGTLTMQTKNTMHTAEGHIKIDAEQIHLG